VYHETIFPANKNLQNKHKTTTQNNTKPQKPQRKKTKIPNTLTYNHPSTAKNSRPKIQLKNRFERQSHPKTASVILREKYCNSKAQNAALCAWKGW